MAFHVNKVFLLGNLGRDAETSYTPGGKAVTKFSVATERSWKDGQSGDWKKATTWTNVVMWGNEKLAAMLTKGSKVHVEGRLETRSYDNKEGKKVYVTEVISDAVIKLDANNASENGGGYEPSYGDEDVPF